MNQDELKHLFRDATAAPPPGSRERVWRALDAPVKPRSQLRLIPLFLVATAAGVAFTLFVMHESPAPLRWSDPHSAVLSTTARAVLDPSSRRVTLESGEVALSSWGAPLELFAVGHTVRVERGVVVVRVAGDSVTVSPVEGVASFDGISVKATAASRIAAGALGQDVLSLESTTAQPRRLLARADAFITERDFPQAVSTLSAVAQLGGLDAEVALYKKGELELHQLSRPEAALDTFDDGDARFASGALRQERQLSAIEACVKLERWGAVLSRTEQFLSEHQASERADELRLLHASALAATGELKAACAEVARLPAGQGAELRASCP